MDIILDRNLHSARLALILLLAGILVTNFALGYAAAEKGEGEKEHGKKGGDEKTAHQDGQGKVNHEANSQPQDNNKAPQSKKWQQAQNDPPSPAQSQQQNSHPPVQPQQQPQQQKDTPAADLPEQQASGTQEQHISESVGLRDATHAFVAAARTAEDRISTGESVAIQS